MKRYYTFIICSFIVAATACKKNETPLVNNPVLGSNNTSLASKVVAPLTVTTIAGKPRTDGFADGTGQRALFEFPRGIDVADDGTLLVADLFNNSIRKVTPAGVVTTLRIPASSDGQTLVYPEQVLVSKDGTLNILEYYDLTTKDQHKVWILKPGGELLTPASQVNYYTYDYYAIAKDPYSNFLQICGDRFVTGHIGLRQCYTENLEINNGVIGTHPYTPPLDSLNTESRMAAVVTNIFCAYNGIKYLVLRRKYVYKLTPSGLFTRIFRDYDFHEITSIIATKDTKTFYVADQGSIKSITNNTVKQLVGITSNTDPQGDGVGPAAYVDAYGLALSKDESTIYFTDQNETIRKLTLK